MKKTIYISGPMSGLPELNFPAFFAAEERLTAAGFAVVNPARLNTDPETSWETCLKVDLVAMMTCDEVVTLPGARNSRGARLEVYVAMQLGMPVTELRYFLPSEVAR